MSKKHSRRKRKSRVVDALARLEKRRASSNDVAIVMLLLLIIAGGNPMGVGEWTLRAAHAKYPGL